MIVFEILDDFFRSSSLLFYIICIILTEFLTGFFVAHQLIHGLVKACLVVDYYAGFLRNQFFGFFKFVIFWTDNNRNAVRSRLQNIVNTRTKTSTYISNICISIYFCQHADGVNDKDLTTFDFGSGGLGVAD